MRLADNTQFRARDRRKPNHHWADNEVLDDFAPRIGAYGYAVYMYICRWAGNTDGRCTRSQREIANAFGISTDTVARAVQKLIEARLIIKKNDPGWPSEFIVMEVAKRFERPDAHSDTRQSHVAAPHSAHGGKETPLRTECLPRKAAHLPPTAARNKEARLFQDFSQDAGANRPSWMIAQKQFWDEFERQAPRAAGHIANVEAERFYRFRAAANRVGLSAAQAKKILLEHPAWKNWRYTADLDSQREVVFPNQEETDSEKSCSVAAETPAAQTLVVHMSPESEARAAEIWEHVSGFVKARISPNSHNTWIKPLRAVALDQGMLIVRVPTREFKHVGNKYAELIAQAIDDRQNAESRNVDSQNIPSQSGGVKNHVRIIGLKFVTEEEMTAAPRARSA
jgi:hypothetical protein